MKKHLRNSRINPGLAKCGNNKRHYDYGLITVSPKEFRDLPPADRCKLCEGIYLVKRNQERKAKGLESVTSPFEGQDHN